jgi:AcrR family transcriptional regulator
MARWEPGARDRLQGAALELFTERGFEATTVADIAERTGVTERTFFRHFADKREVLFAGEELLLDRYVEAIRSAQHGASARQLVATALDAGGGELESRRGREFARMRNAIVSSHESLRERELLKMQKLSQAIADALSAREVDELTAGMGGELAVSAFLVAFRRWIAEGETRTLVELQRESLAAVSALSG